VKGMENGNVRKVSPNCDSWKNSPPKADSYDNTKFYTEKIKFEVNLRETLCIRLFLDISFDHIHF